jgi:hypothetical protein
MGYIKHHSIIICTYDEDLAKKARQRAKRDFGNLVSPLRKTYINNWWSFAILPDGSKEGWPESNMFDEARDSFKGWIIKHRYEDDSNPYDAVEVWFDEEGKTMSKIFN